jgi:hypothetical protein
MYPKLAVLRYTYDKKRPDKLLQGRQGSANGLTGAYLSNELMPAVVN